MLLQENFEKILANRYFLLGVLVFLATIGLWFRQSLFGFDSYATLAAVRFGWFDTLGGQPVANLVWNIIPDSLFVFNLMMFLSIFVSMAGFWKLVIYFYGERLAWISVFLLMGLSPIILFGFGEFENEILAYPFIVWSIYFLLTKKWRYSLVCACFGLLFWKWVHYLQFFNFGGSSILEMKLFANVLSLWLLIPFIFVIPLIKNRWVKWFGVGAVFLFLWNAKLFIFLLPFVALSIANVIQIIENQSFINSNSNNNK